MSNRAANGLVFDLLAMWVLLTFAALGQSLCGPWLWGMIKPPFLVGVGAYYLLYRKRLLSILASIGVGIFLDGLSSVAFPAGMLSMLGMVFFTELRGRKLLNRTMFSCGLLGVCVEVAMLLMQAIALSREGRLGMDWEWVILRIVVQGALTYPMVMGVAWTAWMFERLTGNCPPDEKKGGLLYGRTY